MDCVLEDNSWMRSRIRHARDSNGGENGEGLDAKLVLHRKSCTSWNQILPIR